MNESNRSRNRIVLIAVVAVIALCLVAAVSAVIGGAAGFIIARNRQGVAIQRLPAPDNSHQPNRQTHGVPNMPGMPRVPNLPGDQMPMAPGMMGTNGALIHAVTADGPAAAAGIKVGDLITAVDGKQLSQDFTLGDAIAAYKPGDQAKLTFRRNASEQTMTVTLGQHPEDAAKPYLGVTFVTMPVRQTPGQ